MEKLEEEGYGREPAELGQRRHKEIQKTLFSVYSNVGATL
jgi:hypothetical protein